MRFFLITFIISVLPLVSDAQITDTASLASVNGTVFDSAHNYVLRSATVAVYKSADSSLVNYTLTNNLGEFDFKKLRLLTPYYLLVTYVGYQDRFKQFKIVSGKSSLDLGHINMNQEDGTLETVIVRSVPPVRMNKDTLEFNADAFKIDPNSQVEDLLKRLPNVTVWSDGAITVNGRQVSNVLVNKKPFFGSDSRVAIQNLPKSIVEKVQVYQKQVNPNEIADSILEMNIQLKRGKDYGYFGKVSAGYGTKQRFEFDGMLNIYRPCTQLGLVATRNNINKVADNIDIVLRNNTFKGEGASIEYQTNYLIPGANSFASGGVFFLHDFIDDPGYNKNNRITANYFIRNNNAETNRNTVTAISLVNNKKLVQTNDIINNGEETGQTLNVKYENRTVERAARFAAGFESRTINNTNQTLIASYDESDRLISTNTIANEGSARSTNVNAEAYISKLTGSTKLPFEFSYKARAIKESNNREFFTAFKSAQGGPQDIYFNRLYKSNSSGSKHNLDIDLPKLKSLFHNKIYLGFNSGVFFSSIQSTDQVTDRDAPGGEKINRLLTNRNDENILQLLPALRLRKETIKGLANRYQKTTSIEGGLQNQLYIYRNNSDQSFRNINRNFNVVSPFFTTNFVNSQYGRYINNYILKFSVLAEFPTLLQLAPLPDSINIYYIRRGNVALEPEKKNELSAMFNHTSSHQVLNYNLSITGGYSNNYLSDSTITDSLGRSNFYTVNISGYRYVNVSATVLKGFKFKKNQLQLNANSTVSLSRSPQYINGIRRTFRNIMAFGVAGINYMWGDFLVTNFTQRVNLFYSRQTEDNFNAFNRKNFSSELSASLKCTPRITLNTSLIHVNIISKNTNPERFNLLNANLKFRLLKDNNMEVKFSALDILKQNKGIINYGMNNSITYGNVNVLRQYFMLTLSYFPRKFGKERGSEEIIKP